MFNQPLSTTAAISSNHLTQPTDTQYWANAEPALGTDLQLTPLLSSQQPLSPFNMLESTFNLDMLHYPDSPSDSNFSTVDQDLAIASHHKLSAINFDDSSVSPNALQLCSTQEAEQSFIYDTNFDGSIMPVKMSQDYGDDCSILDEVNLISEHGFYYPPGTQCQREFSFGEAAAVGIPLTESPLPMEELSTALNKEDLAHETVSHHSDVMLSVFTLERPPGNFVNNNNYSYKVTSIKPEVLTPEASPKSTPTVIYTSYSDEEEEEGDEDEKYFDQENQVNNEHNYNSKPNIYTQTNLLNCKRKLHLNEDNHQEQIHHLQNIRKRKLHSDVVNLKDQTQNYHNYNHLPAAKKAKITSFPSSFNKQQQTQNTTTMRHRIAGNGKLTTMLHLNLQAANDDRVRSTSMSVNTPVLESSMLLDLEHFAQDYDLVDFINSSQVNILKALYIYI